MKSWQIKLLLILLIFVFCLTCIPRIRAQTYDYLTGDVNMRTGIWPPQVVGSDVTYLVNYFRGMDGVEACLMDGFWASADANGDCQIIGSDVTRLVNFFRGISQLTCCESHPPSWPTPDDIPADQPDSWPDCFGIDDRPPEIDDIAGQYVSEGSHLELRITAIDPDGDEITLLAESLPINSSFTDSADGIGGFIFDPDFEQAGQYQVKFIANSTNLADTESVDITVYNTNRAPVLVPIGAKIILVDSLLEFQTSAHDPDGSIPDMYAVNLPGDASYIDNNDGTADFSWTPGRSDIGVHQVIFIVSDSVLADTEQVNITVQDTMISQAIIADHTFCDAADSDWLQIPQALIDSIMVKYNMYYRHTSHGSQICAGMELMNSREGFPNFYNNVTVETGHVGEHGDTTWAPYFRSYLSSHPECNMVSISWCWEHLYYTEAETQMYLDKMNQLETDYPDVIFVYQTGRRYHPDDDPELNHRRHNNQIRNFCLNNGKVLFDFADIESYDPDGTYYYYDSDACQWCTTWCSDPDHGCANDCACSHSHCFNCWQKGRAWWVLLARLEGWTGE